MDFVHLHMHTEYSLLDGASKTSDLINRLKELNYTSVAITDHGNMFGVMEMYKKCKKAGIKLIVGSEVYLAKRSRFDKDVKFDKEPDHLILLCENMEGYKNLVKLTSFSYTEGFYYKPRIDMELLKKYSRGLICLSGCLASTLSRKILTGNIEEAESVALKFKEIFGKDRYYIELQDNKLSEQTLVNQASIKIARKHDINIVATNDCHYLTKDDYMFHELMLCIQTKKTINDDDRMSFKTNEMYVKSKEEMEESFKLLPEAILNTVKISDMCNVEFEFGKPILPEFKIEKKHREYLRELCYNNIDKKYINADKNIEDRINYELEVIDNMGFTDYFLIVSDFVNYAKKNNIPVGPGRGSGAGSIVAYLIGITDIDPIKYNLLFERFLNPERVTMPDFDIDFCYERRGEVIDYVSKKYGETHVAQIITFGTMAARQAIRDFARALDIDYAKADMVAKLIPNELNITIDKAFNYSRELRDLYDNDDEIRNLIDMAKKAEGIVRHASIHAAGVVITKEEVSDYVPIYVGENNNLCASYTMNILEELGLLKMDFLGLRTLTVIDDAEKLVLKNKNIKVKYDEDMNDQNVFKMLSEGKTSGVFQLESEGIKNVIKLLKPNKLEDIIVLLSLYRPGPMDQIPRYIKNKESNKDIVYTHESLKDILKVTYGCIVYQEQVMQIFRDIGGYSLGRADIVRRAISKKKLDVMQSERITFVNGAIKNNVDEISANKIFDEMIDFAKYAFNKSHAASYAKITYKTAYLKTYFKEEFMAAVMNSFIGNLDKISEYIETVKDMGIKVTSPDINLSETKFTSKDNEVIFSLSSIKNTSSSGIEKIIEIRREKGIYTSFIDFLEKMVDNLTNKKTIESLIKSGAFENIEKRYTRQTLLENYERLIDGMLLSKRRNIENQLDMFGLVTDKNVKENNYEIYESENKITKKQELDMEKEVLGMYVSGSPLDEYKKEMLSLKANNTSNLEDKKEVTIFVIVDSIKVVYTKKNEPMAFILASDNLGQIELVVFPKIYNNCSHVFEKDNVLKVEGVVNRKENDITKILVNKVDKMTKTEKIYIKLTKNNFDKEVEILEQIEKVSDEYYGTIPIYIYYEGTKRMKMLSRKYFVDGSNNAIFNLKRFLGEENVKKGR